ncbi:XRE family transcriptional regulator [Sporolactobacillus shoreicorticis]|uniref:LexA family transcriptional regulator n=1 Tax=Sporolactobacillus shoreicorticis TaxID=1923877 RepID=A0ABW5SAA5_9BACL|nr:XRE family transcriptional regulator [Sporolactobacillus shoreicorticis]MCO7126182.1 XRE family transcriptional regulator [Sporolactobacillus shoreicorticis]
MVRPNRTILDEEIARQISFNLNKIISKRKITQADLSALSGISKTTLSGYFTGTSTPTPGNSQLIADALKINKEDFDPRFSSHLIKSIGSYSDNKIVELPLYGDIAAGALSTLAPITKNDIEHIQVPIQFFNGHSRIDAFALHVNGESMNKIIPNHSYVICLPLEKSNLSDGQIVIFSHDGEYSMKRFINNAEDEVLIFRPESNDSKFRDIVIDYDTTRDLKIYAKVIGYYVNLEK